MTIEYRIRPDTRQPFVEALFALSDQRRRDGAFDWDAFEDAAEPGRFIETFLVSSWVEHLRQHERVTHEGRVLQERVNAYHVGAQAPLVSHLIAVEPAQG